MPRLQNADPFDAALGRDPDGNRLDSENVAGASKSDGNRDTEKLVWYGVLVPVHGHRINWAVMGDQAATRGA